jgi:hypothetical protein
MQFMVIIKLSSMRFRYFNTLVQGELHDIDGLIWAVRVVFEVDTDEPMLIIMSKTRWRACMHQL